MGEAHQMASSGQNKIAQLPMGHLQTSLDDLLTCRTFTSRVAVPRHLAATLSTGKDAQ